MAREMMSSHEQREAPAALLLDMDGVLFHGDRALPHAAEFLDAIAGIPHCFVTNNPIRPPSEIADHFSALGLPRPDDGQIFTSAQATAAWLANEKPSFRFFAIGASGLHEALAVHGTADAASADYVVVGEGPGLDFATISTAVDLIVGRGARLICTNPDHSVDATIDGRHRVLPGGGALVAPIAVATGKTPLYIGKPNPLLYQMAMACLGVSARDCLMVGDRPDTDIAGAQALQMQTALVRTGRFGMGDILPEEGVPDFDCRDLAELTRQLRRIFPDWLK